VIEKMIGIQNAWSRRQGMIKNVKGAAMIVYLDENGLALEATDLEGNPLASDSATMSIDGSRLVKFGPSLDSNDTKILLKSTTAGHCCWRLSGGVLKCSPAFC